MASLMKIPYFAQIVEEKGAEWLAEVFDALETEDFDFSQFEDLDFSTYGEEGEEEPDLTVDAADAVPADDGEDEEADDEAFAISSDMPVQAKVAALAEAAAAAEATASGVPEHFDNEGTPMPLWGFLDSNRYAVILGNWLRSRLHRDFDGDGVNRVVINGFSKSLNLAGGDDHIYAVGRNATIYGTWRTSTIDGGSGVDTLHLTGARGYKVTLGGYSDFGRGGNVRIINVENVIGSAGDDTITGDDLANRLDGGAGNDTLSGGAGNDTVIGGAGDDKIDGGAGDDNLEGGNGNDTIDGGDGNDKINGGAGNDILNGGAGDDIIYGGAGDDKIDGGAGKNTLYGEAGNDTITGGKDADTIHGGDGNDTIDGGAGNDILNGDAGADTIDGGQGDDTISGGEGNDTLRGGAGNDTIKGDAGNDKLEGGAGDDKLDGGAGDDELDGGDGNDTLSGGDGKDVLKGGAGKDVFIYTDTADSGATDNFDIITDFTVADDVLDLSALSSTDEFVFKGTDEFAGGGEIAVRYVKDGNATMVQVDINGDGTADMQIKLNGALDLAESNFVL